MKRSSNYASGDDTNFQNPWEKGYNTNNSSVVYIQYFLLGIIRTFSRGEGRILRGVKFPGLKMKEYARMYTQNSFYLPCPFLWPLNFTCAGIPGEIFSVTGIAWVIFL